MTIKEVIKQTEGRRLEFRRKVWFDSELVMSKPVQELNIENFKREYRDKTGEELDAQVLRKLELVKMMNGTEYPNNALILFSDDELRQSLFPFAKVECALFKGVTSEEFIDQKSISSNLSMQAEEAYNFVLRHINKGAVVEGVYTISHWEYPIKAIREAIRNAVVHRDYSLAGKDVKVAVYDDMVEITSPGLLPPSIDYAAMESRQSDARNKIIAPVFKRMGIIDQWGNGLKLIADELKEYPQIEFRWKEAGLSFQVQFVKIDYRAQQELQQEQQDLQQEQQELQQDLQQEQQDLQQELQQELNSPTMYTEALCKVTETALSRKEISEALRQKRVSGQLNKILSKLIDDKLIEHTIPEIKNHPDQKFRITKRGVVFLALLKKQRYGER